MHYRIALRAYYAAQNDSYKHSPEEYWLAAERVELFEAGLNHGTLERLRAWEKRSEAAKRGAATRKRNKLAIAVPASFAAYTH